jgi:hypothetical protein
MDGYWFKSSKFEIEPGEDKEVKPGMYGRQLARWLKQRLEEKGYAVEDIVNEEWGRCLLCSRDPFMLWVGCGNMKYPEGVGEEPVLPSKEPIVWRCFVAAEVPHFIRYFRKVDTAPAVSKLYSDLGEILCAEPAVVFVLGP